MSTQLKNDSPLGLGAVLDGSLPAKLTTDDALDRYTVEAVFTRQAHRDEVAAIHDGATRDHLSTNRYPTVELHISDQPGDGLAQVIAEHLSETTASSSSRTPRADEDASARADEWISEGGAARS